MSVEHRVRVGFRLRRVDGGIEITARPDRPAMAGSRRALFLFLSRDIPAVAGSPRAGASGGRAECGILVDAINDGAQDRIVAMTTRHPDVESPDEKISWLSPPSGAIGSEALIAPLFADIVDLAARMDLERDMSVAVHGAGIPLPFLAGPLALHGARMVSAGASATARRLELRHLLYRPDAPTIVEYLSSVPDGSLTAIYAPEPGELTYDFYPHVHRRGLHLMHGSPGDGRPMSDSEWRMVRGAMEEASIPVTRIPEPTEAGAPRLLDLPPGTGAFILQIDV